MRIGLRQATPQFSINSRRSAGALADRYGATGMLVAGGLLYVAGLLDMALAESPVGFVLGTGLLIGLAQSGAGFGVVLGVVGRAFPEDKHSFALGVAGASGSFGQFAMLPGAQALINALGWAGALFGFAVLAHAIVRSAQRWGLRAHRPRPGRRTRASRSARRSRAQLRIPVCGCSRRAYSCAAFRPHSS